MKVSVIVPIYNVEKYLPKCLDSLSHQTLKDIEIILVNDDSPDNCEEIIKKYVQKYPNIKYFKKNNGGVSSARNYGLQYATGDYIGFVDSDDYVSLDMYEKMYEKAISKNFDMVVCDINYVYDSYEKKIDCGIKNDTFDIKKVFLKQYPAVWNKIIKRELIEGLSFKEGVWFEDVEFTYRLLSQIKSVGVVHEAFNQYVQRDNSIVHTVSPHIYDYLDNMDSIIDYYKEKDLFNKYQKCLEYVYVRYLYATFIKSSLGFDYQEYLSCVDKARERVKKIFPHYRRNKYFYQSFKGIYLLIFNKLVAKIYYRLKGRKK